MKNIAKILLAEDELNFGAVLESYLRLAQLDVIWCKNGKEAFSKLKSEHFDLCILDIMMPKQDGIETCRQLRELSELANTFIIFLTARSEEYSEVAAFDMGADDYIKKPFSQRLLIERIKAVIRRIEAQKEGGDGESETALKRGDMTLVPAQHVCKWKDKPVNLTVTEFLIIQALAARPGHVKSRDQLIDAAYGENIYVDDRTIDSHIKRLRKKFRHVDDEFANIETLYGVGYKYREAAV